MNSLSSPAGYGKASVRFRPSYKLLLAGFFSLQAEFPMLADEPVPPTPKPVADLSTLVVALPEVSPQVVKHMSKTTYPSQSSPRVEYATPSELASLETLRVSMIPARLAVLEAAHQTCQPGGHSFPALLEQIASAIDHVDIEKASSLLRHARELLACGEMQIPSVELGQLLLLEASLQLERNGKVGGILDEALAVAPLLPFPATSSTLLQAEFGKAHSRQGNRPTIPITVDRSGLDGLTLLLDGEVMTADQVALTEGRHFLQVANAEMQVISGAEFEVKPRPGAKPERWPPALLRPPDREAFLGQLQQQLDAGELTPTFAREMRTLLKARGLASITLIAPARHPSTFRALTLNREGPVQANSVRLEPTPLTTTMRWVAAGAGACAVGAGVAYGYTWYRIKTEVFEWDEGLSVLGRNHVAGATFAACTGGGLLSVGVSQFWPRLRVASNDGWTSLQLPHLVLSPGAIQIQLGGVW